MNLSDQHLRALTTHLKDITGAGDASITAFLRDLFGEVVTYDDAKSVDVATVTTSLAAAGVTVPGVKRATLAALFQRVHCDLSVCDRCGRFRLAAQGAEWRRIESESCPACDGGVFVAPETTTFLGWADGRQYPTGTTHDADRRPIDADSILRERPADEFVRAELADAGVTVPAFLRALLTSGKVRSPATALIALSRWEDIFATRTELRVFLRDVKRGAPLGEPLPPETSATSTSLVGVDTKALRVRLAGLYGDPRDVIRLAKDAGLSLSRVDFTGPMQTVWFNVLEEAKHSRRLDALLRCVREEYPNAGF